MSALWEGVAEDFREVPEVGVGLRLVVRLLLAAVLGGLLGWERYRAGKDAGLRTHMLVALGSAFFLVIPHQVGMAKTDVSRVLQGLIGGIGFFGAGAIIKASDQPHVRGFTTAAGLWMAAAVGAAAGLGRAWSAILGAVLALVILSFIRRIEHRADQAAGPENAQGR
jgi:putative Mg2+ transporter-C (MgtC) family protein